MSYLTIRQHSRKCCVIYRLVAFVKADLQASRIYRAYSSYNEFLQFLLRKKAFMHKRIEIKVSLTAKMVCLKRAMSNYEKNENYKSKDYLASFFISPIFNLIAKYSISRKFLKKFFFGDYGSYEYIISRTKLIDEIIDNYANSVQQVVIFGAGFDSRAIRFQEKLKHTNIFELDCTVTQKAKIDKFKEKNIKLPTNLKFISIDFDKEQLWQKLNEANFEKNKPTLFILEGLTYYLSKESIDSTFNIIKEYSGQNSIIVFDYLYSSVLRQENIYKGEKELYNILLKIGEKYNFGIEKGQIKEFLDKYNLELIENFDSDKLGEKFFTNKTGKIFASTIGIYSISVARKNISI